MSASVYKINATGAAAINASLTVPAGDCYRLVSVTCKLSAAPTTSENFTVTLDAHAGPVYDVLLYSVDLAAGATTSLVWQPDEELFIEGHDSITLAYTNTDVGTYGVQMTLKAV